MKNRKRETVFMVVTNDEYELPLAVGTRQKIAEFLGMKTQTLSASFSRGSQPKDTRFRVIKQELADDL